MPPTSTPSGDERRATAQRARRERAGRIARLRRQIMATALGTFALAFGVIAFDGSMGSTSAKSSAATPAPASEPSAATSAAQPSQDDFSSGDDFSPADGGSSSQSSAASSDPLTTSQS